MSLRIEKDFSGLHKLIKNMKALDGACIEWGFFEDKRYGPDNDNLPVATVALLNERGGVGPARPFFSASFDRNKKEYLQLSRRVVELAIASRSWQGLLQAIGKKAVKDVKDSIETWYTPLNSPAWQAFKRSVGAPSKPLEYTLTMLDSVDYKVEHKKGENV